MISTSTINIGDNEYMFIRVYSEDENYYADFYVEKRCYEPFISSVDFVAQRIYISDSTLPKGVKKNRDSKQSELWAQLHYKVIEDFKSDRRSLYEEECNRLKAYEKFIIELNKKKEKE